MQIPRLLLALSVFCLRFAVPSSAAADVYVYTDKQGVLTFTNVPTQHGYRRVIRDASGRGAVPSSSDGSFDSLIVAASDRHRMDPDLVRAVIRAESNFNSSARSEKGAIGLMQLMPDTARLHNVIDSFSPSENIEGGVRHLKLLLGRYQGDLELTLAAYNAGIKAVEKYGGIPPFLETQDYVRRVLRYYDAYRSSVVRTLRQVQQAQQ